MTTSTERIAIVGLGIRFPGVGADREQFWQAIASARDLSREVPETRWALPPDRCLDPRIAHPDAVYTSRGYYLDPFEPDLNGLEIDPTLIAELDTLFHIILDAGHRAWRSAKTDAIDRSRVGVILGNICLPTAKSNALCREYLGARLGRDRAKITHPLNRFVAGLPAGVLAQALGLGGGSYTLDAACASSLYALKLAADELLAGRADAMLAGGANGSDPQYTQMGFAQLRALSPSGRCSPFDQQADGLLVGEGAGIFVLKRLRDALKHGDRIYAVIAGVGLSNDMHGNLLAPAVEGQLRAMRTAYDNAGWQANSVDLIECHATGTPVGDAIEFESLRTLWGEAGWSPGQCAIGSVKSTVGHLLTGAGAAAVAKVLLALQHEILPPQANFTSPAAGLHYHDGPFRVLDTVEHWRRRSSFEPRRAAVSGFGFGGVNAHLLLEEWTGIPPTFLAKRAGKQTHPLRLTTVTTKVESASETTIPKSPIAVVGMAAHFGPWTDLRAFQERILGGDTRPAAIKQNGWSLARLPCPPGFLIEELNFPIDRFRIPPRELEETLPQQLLMLKIAAAALDDCRSTSHSAVANHPRTGVFIGLGLDPNTTNFHLRWSVLADASQEVADAASPPLTANRTMGALGSIAASRIARAFHFGGPSHTVCSEEASAARAVELAVRALQAQEIDRALVGGVDLAGDPRLVLPGGIACPGEGAAALIFKRLADAERDGDQIYAVIRGLGVATDIDRAAHRAADDAQVPLDSVTLCDGPVRFLSGEAKTGLRSDGNVEYEIGSTGAASAAASLVKVCVALEQEIIPPFREESSSPTGSVVAHPPRYWLHDRASGPRRAAVTARGSDGTCVAIIIDEYERKLAEPTTSRRQPLGARSDAIFAVCAPTTEELLANLDRFRVFISEPNTPQIEALARRWYRESPLIATTKHAMAFVARSSRELQDQIAYAVDSIRSAPSRPLPDPSEKGPHLAYRDRVFYSPHALGPKAKVALVYPGSGSHFDGMGRELSVQWPEILRRQQYENQYLRSQFAPEYFWNDRTAEATPRDLMFGQVSVGSLVSDILVSLGLSFTGMIGISLGESAGLFGIRAWTSRDEMYRRMKSSTLFNSDLAPPYNAARKHWGIPATEPIEWRSGVIAAGFDDVIAALRPGLKAYLLIVNSPTECVIGGRAQDLEQLVETIGKGFYPLAGVTIAHCDVGSPVELPYRELHTLPVTAPRGVTVYSGVRGRSYVLTEAAAADSITAGLLHPIHVPAVINAAYRDGFRVFIEVGPGSSTTRLIDVILGDKPHLARAAHVARQDALSQILRLVANLIAERIPIDLTSLYGCETVCVAHREHVPARGLEVVIPVGQRPTPRVLGSPPLQPELRHERVADEVIIRDKSSSVVRPVADSHSTPWITPVITGAVNARLEIIHAHEAFLRVNQRLMDTASAVLQVQTALLQHLGTSPDLVLPPPSFRVESVPRRLTYEQCCTFAAGKVGDVLGPMFAEADSFPTRVRLPDGPLQLVDQITAIEGEPRSLTSGRVVTTHTVRADRWYLEAGRIPTAIAVESGQADLFLSGYLGIDFETRGLAVYRLLDAVVAFHRGLPTVGETIVYDIHIDEFVKQGDAWLFRFRFDGTVNGEPFITMRNGVAGFFTAEALAAGKGIVQTALDRQRLAGQRPADWCELVSQRPCALDWEQVNALRNGNLVAAFGAEFTPAARTIHQRGPVATLPGGMLRLVDRVPLLDPTGGRFGIGFVRAEFDIHPNDWFLTCHFVDDRVMPGTLMYECCLHTLRILLMRMGWVGAEGEVVCEPVPGVNSRLKCRGQVIETTKTVTYEVTVKELGYRPEPYCLADALMYADGKPIVEITNMSLRMTGLTRERLNEIWQYSTSPSTVGRDSMSGIGHAAAAEPQLLTISTWLYDSASILAFSNGKPSDAFGEPYRIFDSGRVIARLPGPPFQFLDGITAVSGEPFVMKAGAVCRAHYAVPEDGWYFAENRGELMPFSVLLEIALQPCGWLAAYCGSALTSTEDLSFRNLGGQATQFRPVTRYSGPLTIDVKLTNVSQSAGMIIQHYDMRVSDLAGVVYEGTTYFGFFSKPQLANQVGIRDAKVPWPSGLDMATAERGLLPHVRPFPGPMMRMIDRIEAYLPDGGTKRLGLVVGRITVDPEFWFFKAHFYQDPVWPGSLGLESFLQLLKYAAWRRWGAPAAGEWQTVALKRPHAWTYRGQVLPNDREVTVLVEITAVDDDTHRLTANGFLTVDGRVIYQMTDFTLE